MDDEMKEKIQRNVWDTNTEELFDLILKASKSTDFTWSWSRSDDFKCKYINIRIDMRDGGFILTNDAKKRLSAYDLWNQGITNQSLRKP